MLVTDFDYELPPELIAQEPPPDRVAARLLVLDRGSGRMTHATVAELPEVLTPGDLLVVNNTRVIHARLLGRRVPSGGAVECLLLERLDGGRWLALVHPGQKLKPGAVIEFRGGTTVLRAEVEERLFFGRRVIRLWRDDATDVDAGIEAIGHVPLPPYIRRPDAPADEERYQTVYAKVPGSVAAPTAGLHFSAPLLAALAQRGIERTEITLHVGYGTFKPVRSERVEDHTVDPESYEIRQEAAAAIDRARRDGRRVIAVGTTTTRALETAAQAGGGTVNPGSGRTDLFICPGHRFLAVNGLLTNFHLPRSSLLMLVCAFGGQEAVLAAYREAVARRYRFFSYGDGMLIT